MRPHTQSFEQTPIDRTSIPQDVLDLDSRERTNLFPWRGQFSPCLVEAFLSEYTRKGDRVLDPFAGVGTTLFEASRKELSSFGTEINPAAVAMASSLLFVPLHRSERLSILDSARVTLEGILSSDLPLFGMADDAPSTRLIALIEEETSCREKSLLVNTLIRAMRSSQELTAASARLAFKQHSEIVMALPTSEYECSIHEADARSTGLPPDTIDVVVTSPPYINVFNYHQNNRPAMELLGCDVLKVARSEFGSNRKHRKNRLLTVLQYCLDLHSTLVELRRVLKRTGRAIVVVGRESNVRSLPFRNGSIVASLAEIAGFRLDSRQERKFKNMFGELIFEDILHLVPVAVPESANPLAVGVCALEEHLLQPLQSDVRRDLLAALEGATDVRESPLFAPELAGNFDDAPECVH